MKFLFLLIFFILSSFCYGQIGYVDENDINFNDIVEKKGLMYFKSDTKLVTGRVVRFNRKNEAKSYIEVVNGKPQNQNWTNFTKEQKEMKDSDLGNILLGAAFAAGVAMAVTGNDHNIPATGNNFGPQEKQYNQEIVNLDKENRLGKNLNKNSNSEILKNPSPIIKELPENGIFYEYHKNGQKILEVTYLNGKKDGIEKKWFENGQIKSRVNYLDGKKVGQLITYHSNGQLQGKVNYVDGKENGEIMVYNENSEIMIIGFFKEGNQTGEWYYYENGKLIKTENFD